VRIPSGVQALTSDNLPLDAVTTRNMGNQYRLGEGRVLVGNACELGPAGATFDPPVTLLLTYNRARLPQNLSEDSLVIGYYDGAARRWVELKSNVNKITHQVSAPISHFSVYGIMGTPTTTNWVALIAASVMLELVLVVVIVYFIRRRRRKRVRPYPATPKVYLLPPPRQYPH
jgi:hypothetical protein